MKKVFGLVLVSLLFSASSFAVPGVKTRTLGTVVAVERIMEPTFRDCKLRLEETIKEYAFDCKVTLGSLGNDRYIKGSGMVFEEGNCHVWLGAHRDLLDYGYTIMTTARSRNGKYTKDEAIGCISRAFLSGKFKEKEVKATFYTIQ